MAKVKVCLSSPKISGTFDGKKPPASLIQFFSASLRAGETCHSPATFKLGRALLTQIGPALVLASTISAETPPVSSIKAGSSSSAISLIVRRERKISVLAASFKEQSSAQTVQSWHLCGGQR